jgi:hypothetical protein
MNIAVVGNGPSAAQYGKRIDRCNFVVRINTHKKHFPDDEAGKKLSSWAWFGQKSIPPECIPTAPCEFWLCARPPDRSNVADFARCLELAGANPTRIIPVAIWNDLHARLKAIPSTGIQAVHMALEMKPKKLVLAGFDYDSSWQKCNHSPVNEKTLLEELCLAKDGVTVEWLGHAD